MYTFSCLYPEVPFYHESFGRCLAVTKLLYYNEGFAPTFQTTLYVLLFPIY